MSDLELNDIDVRDLVEFMQRDGRPLASACRAISGVEPASFPAVTPKGGHCPPLCPGLPPLRSVSLPHVHYSIPPDGGCHTSFAGMAHYNVPSLANLIGYKLAGRRRTQLRRRDRAWLERWVKVADQVLAKKDPLAMEIYEKYDHLAMPNLKLNDIDARDLVAFMQRDGRPLASACGAISGVEPASSQ